MQKQKIMQGLKMCLVLFIIMGIVSCKKEAGDGGFATIEGYVFYDIYTPSGILIEQIPAGNEDVYIIYGENTTYDDRVDTDAEGKYRFKRMQKGNYRLYAFSDCLTCASGKDNVGVSVEITDKKGTTIADDIIVTNNLDYNDGIGSIQGIVMEQDYDTAGVVKGVPYILPDENVYIVYGNDIAYFDKTKTNGAGVFQFTNLLKGSYRVYVFSDCPAILNCPDDIEEKDASAVVSNDDVSINVGTITIEKR